MMIEILILGVVQTAAVVWVLIVQRRFKRDVAVKIKWMQEMLEDAGWNWERDDMHTQRCATDKPGWEPANSKPSNRASG